MIRKLIQTILPIAFGAVVVAFVPAQTEAGIPQRGTTPTQKIVPVDLNTADAKTLAGIPGVGDVLAAAIIKERPFKSVDDLKKVKGIGAGPKFDSLKPYFVVATRSGTPAASKGGSQLAPGEKININTANATDLARLPDVGETKSKAIIDYRTAHGPFGKIDDIKKVPGIKEGTFAKIKNLIVVK